MPFTRNSLIIILISVLIFSCKKNNSNETNQDKYSSYFGLSQGRYIIYDVREILHDETAEIKHDTLNYQLKTVIGDTIFDNAGRLAYKYYRYKRSNAFQNWVMSDVWTILIDENQAELTEENQRIIKLFFPVSDITNWNANVFNLNESLDCSYDKIHQSKSLSGLLFDSTVTVEQENERNLIQFKRKYEVYGNRIGLIKKYFKDLKINNFDTLNIKSGSEIFYNCIDFGFE